MSAWRDDDEPIWAALIRVGVGLAMLALAAWALTR